MNIATSPRWSPATLTEKTDKDPMTIDFVMTKAEKDHALICELERRAMQAHRDPPGLVVGMATESEWNAAVEARRGR